MMDQQAMMNNMMAMMAVLAIPALIIGLLMLISEWIILSKAGKPGWALLIPIYNAIVLLQVIGRPWWHIFLFIIPIYGWIILPIICLNQLSKSFGKDTGFTIGLLLLPVVFYPMMAFSKNIKYVGPGGVPAQA
jgi:hypothetical protein